MKSKVMMTTTGLALLMFMASAVAQIYNWTDKQGKKHYSDTPPPPDQVKSPVKILSDNGRPAVELPYLLAGPVRNYPVTLYTTAQCGACDMGRALLESRGIPYTEKTVSSPEDQQKLSQAGSTGQVPLLLIGPTHLVGFEEGAWNGALSDASYPKERILPPNYRNPQPEPAAPRGPSPEVLARAKAEADAAAAAAKAREAKQPPNAPPGFQF
jgi:glutaredoxin